MAGGDRVLYVGTDTDAYELTPKNGEFASRSLGLRGKGIVRGIVVDRRDPKRMYAGTGLHGVQRSMDGGKTWHEANYGITYKNIFALVQHPATGDLFAGTEPASVYRSADGGDTWEDSPALRALPEWKEWFFPRPPHIAHVRSIGVREDDPEDLFCAVEDGWFVRSRDGGKTWAQVKEGVACDAHAAAFMPDDASIVYAATGDHGYRSTNGGESFVRASDGLDRGYMAGIAVSPKRPNVLLTAAALNSPPAWRAGGNGADLAVFRSEDQGKSWRRVTRGLPEYEKAGSWAIAADAEDADGAYLGLFGGPVWATSDGGESFRQIAQLDGSIRVVTVHHR